MLGGGRGGLEQAALDYALALGRRGHEVTCVFRAGAAVLGAATARGLAVRTLARPSPWNPLALLSLRRLLEGKDVILVHGNRAGALAEQAAPGSPIVAVAHSVFFEPRRSFSAVIATTSTGAASLSGNIPVFHVPNMVAVPECPERRPLREPAVIAAMGRLAPEKGFDLLIKAVAILREQGTICRAVIAGDGPMRAALEAEARSHCLTDAIDFAGWVDDKEAFFAGADLFCLSSRRETFGLALLEAMAHAVPCIATNCTGPRELITDGLTGRLVAPEAPALAASIRSMVLRPEEAHAMGQRARASVEGRFSIESVSARLDSVLKEIAGRH